MDERNLEQPKKTSSNAEDRGEIEQRKARLAILLHLQQVTNRKEEETTKFEEGTARIIEETARIEAETARIKEDTARIEAETTKIKQETEIKRRKK